MEKIGWFDAFRERGGPTWYGDNRTKVVTDTGTLGIVLVFALFTAAFMLILPGLRKHVRAYRCVHTAYTLYCIEIELVSQRHTKHFRRRDSAYHHSSSDMARWSGEH
jgi:hypothetical protein